MVTTMFRPLFALVAMIISCQVLAVSVEAKLDTNRVAFGDTVEYTYTLNGRAFGKTPDFSPLEQDFEILSKRQSAHTTLINGEFTAYASWVLALIPKKSGTLTVPSIEFEGALSQPLTLEVSAQNSPVTAGDNRALFLDAAVSKSSVYVQEQLIYTIRVFKGPVDLYDTSFTAPKIDSAIMEQLGDRRQYRSTVNGRPFDVIEFKYALFPQKSGELLIPPAELIANVFQSRSQSFGGSPFNGKKVRRISPQIQVEVKPIPADYPTDQPWLPAKSLQLQERWSEPLSQLKQGEPVTRSIVTEVDGLSPSQIPPIVIPDVAQAKIYPEEGDAVSADTLEGLSSKRTDNFAIIPTQSGTLDLPAIRINWWNVETDSLQSAELPARSIRIAGSPQQTPTMPVTPPLPAAETSPKVEPVTVSAPASNNNTWFWLSLLFALLWVATLVSFGFYVWRQKRQQTSSHQEQTKTAAKQRLKWQQFEAMCKSNDPVLARRYLPPVLQHRLGVTGQAALSELIRQANSPTLEQALAQLDAQLYKPGGEPQNWSGDALLAAVKAIQPAKPNKGQQHSHQGLAPLYPGA